MAWWECMAWWAWKGKDIAKSPFPSHSRERILQNPHSLQILGPARGGICQFSELLKISATGSPNYSKFPLPVLQNLSEPARFHPCHNPMYFFLCNLSVVDIGCMTSTVPKMLMSYLSNDKWISFSGCLSQMYFFISFGGIECLLLGIMAYDQYAAICHPLHYSVLMRPKVCIRLAVTSWILGLSNSGVHTALMTSLSFCQDNVIKHFFCDIPPLFQLSCTDTQINQIATFVFGGGIIMGSFLVTLLSYVYIALAILRIQTKEGRARHFPPVALTWL